MKNRERYSLMIMAGMAVSSSLYAQNAAEQDTTMTREMLIEKQYNPIVRDADKITRMPDVEEPQVVKSSVDFAKPMLQTNAPTELMPLSVGNVNTKYTFFRKKGYLDFGGGNYLNLHGSLGYRFIDTERSVFGAELQHASTSGKVSFDQEELGKAKRRVSETQGKIYYKQEFEKLRLNTDLSYQLDSYNFYGLNKPLDMIDAEQFAAFDAPLQKDQSIDYHLSLTTMRDARWNYKMAFDFDAYWNKLPGIKEKNVELKVGAVNQMSEKWKLHADINMRALFYGGRSGENGWDTSQTFNNNFLVDLNPYFMFRNGNGFEAKLGAKVDIGIKTSPYFGVAPDVTMQWKMADHWLLYGDVTGGLRQNSVKDVTSQYRYNQTYYQLDNTYDVAHLSLGLRTDVAPGLSVDLFGKAGYTANELFMETNLSNMQINGEALAVNSLKAFLYDATSYNFGLKLAYKYSDLFEMRLGGIHYGYNLEKDAIASYKPKFEIESAISFMPMKKWRFTLDYQAKMKREATVLMTQATQKVAVAELVKLDDIHHVNLKVDWLLSNSFKVYGHLNNLLFRKQAYYYGMPEQGFNFALGGTLLF